MSTARPFPGVFARRNGNGAHAKISEAPRETSPLRAQGATDGESEVSDEALVLELSRDISALGVLYRRYATLVYYICSRIIRDPAEAEDLVHEVFLSLYRRCESFDQQKGTAKSWLVQLTYHKCFDWRDYLKARHGFRQGNGDGETAAASSQFTTDRDPSDQAMWNDQIRVAFTKLSKEQRLTVKLRMAGYTFEEIAQALRCSDGNAKNHVYRGIRRLREIIFNGNGTRLATVTGQEANFSEKNTVQ